MAAKRTSGRSKKDDLQSKGLKIAFLSLVVAFLTFALKALHYLFSLMGDVSLESSVPVENGQKKISSGSEVLHPSQNGMVPVADSDPVVYERTDASEEEIRTQKITASSNGSVVVLNDSSQIIVNKKGE